MSAEHKGAYGDEDEGKGEYDFEVTFDPATSINLKTACCCCLCGFDDCNDFMQVQGQTICLWLQSSGSAKCFQCTDESGEALACIQGTSRCGCCSMTDTDKGLACCNMGEKGVCCCCAVGTSSGTCCDPFGAPETCVKVMAQYFCVHIRAALPCDEEQVPFEIGCCGVMCKEAEPANSGHE